MTRLINTICPFCGVGCGINLKTDNNGQLLGVEPQINHPISQGKLCEKGWSSAFAVTSSKRLTQPLKRINKQFYPISWQEALSSISDELQEIIEQYGSKAVGVISSARATNEDNYAAQKFARAVLKTNNIYHCARICHSPTVVGLKKSLGSGPKAENNGVKTPPNFSVPNADIYKSGTRLERLKTRTPCSKPSLASTLAKQLVFATKSQ